MCGSIGVEAENYCYGCEYFEPECRKDILYADDKVEDVTVTVICKDIEKCRRIAEKHRHPG